jgi:hypothetical protein
VCVCRDRIAPRRDPTLLTTEEQDGGAAAVDERSWGRMRELHAARY